MFASLSKLEDLYIYGHPLWKIVMQDNIENTLWLKLLLPFTAVKNLYLSEEFARRIVPALPELVGGGTTEVVPTQQELVGGGMTEVLPSLQNIFWRGSRHRDLSRKASGNSLPHDRPITPQQFLTGTEFKPDTSLKLTQARVENGGYPPLSHYCFMMSAFYPLLHLDSLFLGFAVISLYLIRCSAGLAVRLSSAGLPGQYSIL